MRGCFRFAAALSLKLSTFASTPGEPRDDAYLPSLTGEASLDNSNVGVHIVEPEPLVGSGRHELVLHPAAVQLNGRFTQHVGVAASYIYHLQETFGLQLSSVYHWHATDSALNRELITKARRQALPASALLLSGAVVAGFQIAPVYGKFTFFEGGLGRFAIIFSGGLGVGQTKYQLTSPAAGARETFGETGLKLVGSLGGGVLISLGNHFALRLEIKDLLHSAHITSVNGCGASDLGALDDALAQGLPAREAAVSRGCNVAAFNGSAPRDDVRRSISLPRDSSSDVLNNIGFYAGFSFIL